jgi:hypothetical protein
VLSSAPVYASSTSIERKLSLAAAPLLRGTGDTPVCRGCAPPGMTKLSMPTPQGYSIYSTISVDLTYYENNPARNVHEINPITIFHMKSTQ